MNIDTGMPLISIISRPCKHVHVHNIVDNNISHRQVYYVVGLLCCRLIALIILNSICCNSKVNLVISESTENSLI